ncbi:MAG: ArnT family glycosyltransferase [Phycisphaerae bacterium]
MALLAAAAILAVTSFWNDSLTCDEMCHLASGVSYLKTGDFRLDPDHPPLEKIWAALPLLFVDQKWPGPETPGWRESDVWRVGRAWFCTLNDGERLLKISRCMMVALLLALCLTIYGIAHALFGRAAGLLAMAMSALSPTLLAHGRLVTTDLPLALFAMLTIWTFAALCQRVNAVRLTAAALALSALSLTKYSWPLVLPALAAMAVAAVLRQGLRPGTNDGRTPASDHAPHASPRPPAGRTLRPWMLTPITLALAAAVWLAIWCCLGLRYSPFRDADRDRAMLVVVPGLGKPPPTTMDEAWDTILRHWQDDRPMTDTYADLIRAARKYRLLPEAYLYGLAYTRKTTEWRPAYLMGEIRELGWRSYFPIAFAIKTTIPEMLLFIAGLAAIVSSCVRLRRRQPSQEWANTPDGNAASPDTPAGPDRGAIPRDLVLTVGLITFLVVYGVTAITASINIGHRHIIPIYPVLFVFGGAAACWSGRRWGRRLLLGLVLWQAVVNLRTHPHYLCYFNEFVGGPRNGHRYLLDSNLDWGQDLKRLSEYARARPQETIKLAYFGSTDPRCYGFSPQLIVSDIVPPEALADLTAGTYCISVTTLFGLYDPVLRESFWKDPENLALYRALYRSRARRGLGGAGASMPWQEEEARTFDLLRRSRLLHGLRRRPPDDRIGYSIFVYRLTQADIDALTAP